MISSRDNNNSNNSAYYHDKPAMTSKLEKIQFNKGEALNNSVGNIKM